MMRMRGAMQKKLQRRGPRLSAIIVKVMPTRRGNAHRNAKVKVAKKVEAREEGKEERKGIYKDVKEEKREAREDGRLKETAKERLDKKIVARDMGTNDNIISAGRLGIKRKSAGFTLWARRLQ